MQLIIQFIETPRDAAAGIYWGKQIKNNLQEEATRALLLLALLALGSRGRDHSANGLIEDGLETSLGEGRALHVLDGANLLDHLETLLVGDGALLLASKLLASGGIITKIDLGADEDDGGVGAVVGHLGVPLGTDVLKGRRVHNREADEEDVGLGVGERAETIVVLLT